jgi:hypothetical protein
VSVAAEARYHLYYAGMARDAAGTEQIGLATSVDGVRFERVHGTGLILGTDPDVGWRSLRVCNPTVLLAGGGFLMFYQGIAGAPPHHTSLAVARSKDGVTFDCDPAPCLSLDDMRTVDPRLDPRERIGLIEPSVIDDDGRYRMWFVYSRGSSRDGNELYLADSADGHRWSIRERVLSGHQFGEYNLHYPQVLKRSDGYELWFTLKNRRNGVFGICRMRGPDGRSWGHLAQILPRARVGVQLRRRYALDVAVLGRELRASHVVDFVLDRCLPRRYHAGFAHPHVLPGEDGEPDVLYLHGYHRRRNGTIWMDIARCEIRGDVVMPPRRVLTTGDGAWDAEFVADPFVLRVPPRE